MMAIKNPYSIGIRRDPGWSLARKRCKRCGRTDRPHKSLGLCKVCYQVEWRRVKRQRDLSGMKKNSRKAVD